MSNMGIFERYLFHFIPLVLARTCSAKEQEVHRLFANHGLLYGVPITEESKPPLQGFPWIRPRDFLRAMHQHRDLGHVLAGCDTVSSARPLLHTFWTRYRKIHPGFQLFQQIDQGKKPMELCVPLYLHGDEGVTYKRGGVLILSFQSPLGFGTSKREQELSLNLQNLGESGLPLNFLKSGMYTRILMVMCQKDMGFI